MWRRRATAGGVVCVVAIAAAGCADDESTDAGGHIDGTGKCGISPAEWSRDLPADNATQVAITNDCNVALAGTLRRALDLGGGLLQPEPSAYTSYVALLDRSGKHIWSDVVGYDITGIGVDAQGNVIFGGNSAGEPPFMVEKRDGRGKLVWSRSLTFPADAISVNDAGKAVVAGARTDDTSVYLA